MGQFSDGYKKPGRTVVLSVDKLGKCNKCGNPIAFLMSEAKKKWYPVEAKNENRINTTNGEAINVIANDFHQCYTRAFE